MIIWESCFELYFRLGHFREMLLSGTDSIKMESSSTLWIFDISQVALSSVMYKYIKYIH